jgi:hypothetical protein
MCATTSAKAPKKKDSSPATMEKGMWVEQESVIPNHHKYIGGINF